MLFLLAPIVTIKVRFVNSASTFFASDQHVFHVVFEIWEVVGSSASPQSKKAPVTCMDDIQPTQMVELLE